MKKNFLPAFLLLFLALGLFSCQQGTKETNKEYPMFWTWLDYRLSLIHISAPTRPY